MTPSRLSFHHRRRFSIHAAASRRSSGWAPPKPTRERTKATVERAKAQTEQAKNDLDRTRSLAERGASTVQALERAETAMRVADRDLRAAEFQDHATEHEVAQAKALLAQYTDGGANPPERWNVTAPVSVSFSK